MYSPYAKVGFGESPSGHPASPESFFAPHGGAKNHILAGLQPAKPPAA